MQPKIACLMDGGANKVYWIGCQNLQDLGFVESPKNRTKIYLLSTAYFILGIACLKA